MRMANTKAKDWFSDENEFRQLCGDAQSQAFGERAQEFAAEMGVKAKQHGLETFLTPGQLCYLCTLADQVPPARRNPS
jgi:hypothetical protein